MENKQTVATEGRIAQFAITCAHCESAYVTMPSAGQVGPLFVVRCTNCNRYTAIGKESDDAE